MLVQIASATLQSAQRLTFRGESFGFHALEQRNNQIPEHEQHEADHVEDDAHDCAEGRKHSAECEPDFDPVPSSRFNRKLDIAAQAVNERQ